MRAKQFLRGDGPMRALMITVATLIFAAGFVDEVTRRFPDGLTVWEAEGQWLTPAGSIDHEQSKVLLLVHPDTAAARQSVLAVIEAYRKAFEQQSVLWENARVCVAA